MLSTAAPAPSNPAVRPRRFTCAQIRCSVSDDSVNQPPGKYPRTPHLPFSPEVASDDVKLSAKSVGSYLVGSEIVVTEKLDGGNCCIHAGKVYARTHAQEATHQSFAPIKALVATWWDKLEDDLALFGENMTAVHSIEYDGLCSPFYLFGVWSCSRQVWLSWSDVEATAASLAIPTAPVLYRGSFPTLAAMKKWMDAAVKQPSSVGTLAPTEGFVIRCPGEIQPGDFEHKVAKYVRKGHVQTNDTWQRTWKRAVIKAPPR